MGFLAWTFAVGAVAFGVPILAAWDWQRRQPRPQIEPVEVVQGSTVRMVHRPPVIDQATIDALNVPLDVPAGGGA